MLKEFNISSRERYQLIDITEKVEELVSAENVKDGTVLVFTPHSTTAVLITENEEGLKQDWLALFKRTVSGINFQHDIIDNNADSHILSGLIGQGKTLPIKNGRVIRGTWQQVFLAELDGPKNRRIIVKISE